MSVMELRILPTKHTPEISLNPDGMIKIGGRSMIADVDEFIKQIEDWIDKYICNPADITCVDFHLEYLSTNNQKFYITLLNKIEPIKLKNKKYIINWYYDEGDEDILEKGEYISSVLSIPFNFIKISDPNILSW
jgi:Domain of unknown function (DUF1987).